MTGRVAMVLMQRAQAMSAEIGLSAADRAILLRNLKTPVEDGFIPASAEA